MVPLGSLASIKPINGPLVLTRYNMYPAASINGMATPGLSSGQAIDILKRLAGPGIAAEHDASSGPTCRTWSCWPATRP